MKIGAYSPHNGNLLAEDICGIYFGNVRQDEHSILPVVIRPVLEDEAAVSLELYLQNNGGFTQTQFGYLTSPDFISDVRSYVDGITGGTFISDHFILVSDPPAAGGVPLDIDGSGYGDYVWLDVQAGATETGGTSSINYRFLFEYS